MRRLVMIALVTLLVGCGGGGDDDVAENAATTPTVPAATATTAATAPPATATSPAVTPAPSATATTAPSATPTGEPTPSPTATEVVPTPMVAGSPAADLPVAGQISATIPVGDNPLAVGAGHGSIWVQNDIAGTLSRIDPATNAVVATIQIATPLDPSNPPSDLLGLRQGSPDLALDAASVWAALPEEQAVVQVDPRTNTIIATIVLGADVTSIAVDGSSLWVSHLGTSSVVRVDTATGEVLATIPNVPAPAGIAVQQDAVWVTNYLSDTITRIDPTTNQVVAQIRLGWLGAPATGFQCGLCATEILTNEHGVWVTLLAANAIARIDPATNHLVAIIPVGSQPKSLASDARGLWVGHGGSAGVLLIDPATNQVVAAVPATESPTQLPLIALSENTIWAARLPADDVVRIDLQPE